MKKGTWKIIVLCGFISLAMIACGSEENNDTPEEKQKTDSEQMETAEKDQASTEIDAGEKRLHGAETGEVDTAQEPVVTEGSDATDLEIKSNEKFDVDAVLKKHLDAMEQEKLENIKSMKITGVASQQGNNMNFTRLVKKPNKSRFEARFQSQKMIQVYNGKEGWKYASWTKSEPQPVSPQEIEVIKLQSTIEAILANWKTKFVSVKPAGIVDFEGHEVYSMEVEVEPGKKAFFMIDKNDYLLRGVINIMTIQGRTIENISVFKNYKKTNGIPQYHLVETKANGEVYSTMKVDKYEYNVDVSDDMFEKNSIN